MAYEIESGVAIPEKVRLRGSKYPWDTLTVGKSFFIDGREKKLIIPKRLKPRKFVQEVMNKNGEGSPIGLRIWRTA